MNLKDSDLFKTSALVDGQWIQSDDGKTYPVDNPFDASVIANVSHCSSSETERAVAAAQAALSEWSGKPVKERSAIMRTWFNLVHEHMDDLCTILTTEQGKPLAESKGELINGANFIEWFSEEAKRVYGDVIPAPSSDKRIVCIKQPVGVVACITPWNFPSAMLARKIAPALAAGCTVVCKPANATPLSAFALGELAIRAGVPKGVINIVSGDTRAIGSVLTSNKSIRKLTFTGSTAVGKTLIAQCASTVKRTSMELGGNAPFIVFDDADIDAAVTGAIASKFRNAGQTCVCANRVYVQSSIYEEFSDKLAKTVASLTLGNGLDSSTTMGPLITAEAVSNVLTMIEDAVSKGASVLTGGKQSPMGERFIEPTVMQNVDNTMRLYHEEIFGPVAPLFKFDTEDQVIEQANNTDFGLASYFYSRDIGRIWRVAERLEYGMVGINDQAIANEMAPFGGVKESGQGREGSKYGLDDYTEIKYLSMGGIDR